MSELTPVDHDPFSDAELIQNASAWPAPKTPAANPLTWEYWGEKANQAAENFGIPDYPEGKAWQRDPSKGFWENELDKYTHALKGAAHAFAGTGEEGLRVHPVSAVPMAAYDTYRGLKEFAETPEEKRHVPETPPSAWESMKEAFGGPLPLTGIFAGPKARTANIEALRMAQKLESAGTPREKIWADTGWYQDANKNWRFEIPDDAAKLTGVKPIIEGSQYRFTGLEHPKLEQAYDFKPEIRGEYGIFNPGQRGLHRPGSGTAPSGLQGAEEAGPSPYRPPLIEAEGPTPESARSVALHELQHEVSAREGYPQGSVPEYEAWRFTQQPELEQNPAYAAILKEPDVQRAERKFLKHQRKIGEDLWAENVTPVDRAIWYNLRDDYLNKIGEHAYHRNMDEVLARATQERMNLTPAERMAKPPWLSEDVPHEQQIMRERTTQPYTSGQIGKYAHSQEELPYALVWGEEGGLAAHDVVKSGKWLPKIEAMTKEGTAKEQQQARLRVDYMAQKADTLQREWQHSSQAGHKAAIDDLVQTSASLKQAYHGGDWNAFREAAKGLQAAIDRFAGYTGKHYDAMEGRRNANQQSEHASGGAVRPPAYPHAKIIDNKWMIPDPNNPGSLITVPSN
jgi:hypothetical protein